MKKTSIILGLALTALGSQAMAADLKPGEWEIKRTITSEPAPPGMDKEATYTRCLTAKEADNIERTTRQASLRNGCESPEMDWDGDTLEWTTRCQAGERSLDSSGAMTLEDDEHYTSRMTTRAQGEQPLTIEEEARWAGPCDS
ncbi:DUF3617 domain-containing protein [Alloalcanivorax profundimaris]|uniref:DUF3617 domain-containing protein n=1 Tax=Alloalcanivorax profundimaris TaxID=2735259 RepID=UPI001887EA40|nr:DUF3617 family protein [Alloalcanivorax profundimaris]MBF1803106.1 DUF3617 family protein [Alloalcanivorax profundimaris]